MFNIFKFEKVSTRLVVLISLIISPVLFAKGLSTYSAYPENAKTEVIPFPIEFAPEITLNGVEELVFLKGMYKPEEEDFFSYAFSWTHKIKNNESFSRDQLQKLVTAYYKGLYKAVSGGKEHEPTITLEQQKGKYTGRIKWIEPFVTKQPQVLNFNARETRCKRSNEIRWYFLVSPQPKTHSVWKQLESIEVSNC